MLKILYSPKLAIYLIIWIIVLTIVSTIVPQQGFTDEIRFIFWQQNNETLTKILQKLQLTKIYVSFWLIIPVILLFLNIFFYTTKRLKNSLKNKIKIGLLGSFIFHYSLLIVALGILISSLFSIHAIISLTEGQNIGQFENKKNVSKGIFFKENNSNIIIQLKNFYENYTINKTNTFAAKLKLVDDVITKEKIIYPNNPLNYKGTNIYLTSNWGYSPQIYIKNKDLNFKYYIRLANSLGNTATDYYKFNNYRLNIKFYPDFIKENNIVKSKSFKLKNPVLRLKIFKQDKELVKTFLKLKEKKTLGNFTISFLNIHKWTTLQVSKDYGTPIIFLGFFLSITGLSVRLIFNDK